MGKWRAGGCKHLSAAAPKAPATEAGSGQTSVPYTTLFCDFKPVTALCSQPQFPQLLKIKQQPRPPREGFEFQLCVSFAAVPKSIGSALPSELEALLVHFRAYRCSHKGFTATVANIISLDSI